MIRFLEIAVILAVAGVIITQILIPAFRVACIELTYKRYALLRKS